MIFDKFFKKIKSIGTTKKSQKNKTKNKKQKIKNKSFQKKSLGNLFKSKTETKEEYPNRFLKFYYLNHKRLNNERRSSYKDKQKAGICVRCNQKAKKGIVFCAYHQQRQVNYNRLARAQKKKEK